MNIKDLYKLYRNKQSFLRDAKYLLRDILKEAISLIEDKDLVRANIQSIRIKKFSSFKQKVVKEKWSAKEAFEKCGDLVGGRVTCNNTEDVERFCEILKEYIGYYHNISNDDICTQNHIDKPLQSGYRAIHVNFKLKIDTNSNRKPIHIPCEVQVRSLLQHAWGELTHQDIYKREEIPEDLRARAKDIAEILTAVDKIASDIRSRARQEVPTSEQPPPLEDVSKEGLAWCFSEVFGRSTYDYVIEQAYNICDHFNIHSLEDLPSTLKNRDFRDKINKLYQRIWEMNMPYEDIFLASLYSLSYNEDRAIRWIINNARKEQKLIEQEIQREILSSLPKTIEKFIEYIDTSSIEANDDIEIWAEALGTIDECGYCSMDVVHTDIFAENILEYYDISEEDEDWEDHYRSIESALIHSGVEIGGLDAPDLCARCAAKMEKDD